MKPDDARVALRPAVRTDVPVFTRWMLDPAVAKHLSSQRLTLPDEQQWFDEVKRDSSKKLFSIYLIRSKTLIGNCIIHDVHNPREVSLGILIGERTLWDHGYGTEAIRLLLAVVQQQLTVVRVFLTVDATNFRAQRCYQKCGFSVVQRRRNPARTIAHGQELLMEVRSSRDAVDET